MTQHVSRFTISGLPLFLYGMLLGSPATVMAQQQWIHAGPLPRFGHSAVMDATSNRMVLFGGITSLQSGNGVNLSDVWWLIASGGYGQYWTRAPITGSRPAARSGQSAVYDPSSNRMVIFGGGLGFASPCANDVWSLANANGVGGEPAWTQSDPAGAAPAPRLRHTAVYDLSTNTMIVYGGNDCSSARYSDVWTLSDANGTGGTSVWTQLSPTGTAPAGRENASAVYDPANNRMVVYGGDTGVPGGDSNVWVLTNANGTGGIPAWIELSPTGITPPVREGHSAVYDAVNNVMTIFGGASESVSGTVFNDTWTLSNANGLGSSSWKQLEPSVAIGPGQRMFQSAVYNQSTNKMVIFGGIGNAITDQGAQVGDVYLEDVWVISNANGR